MWFDQWSLAPTNKDWVFPTSRVFSRLKGCRMSDALTIPAALRPVMVRTGDDVRPGVTGVVTVSSGPAIWPGYFMEELHLDESELPSGSSLVSHALLSVVACETGSRIFWRDNGRERSRVIHPGDVFVRSDQEFDGFRWNRPLVVRLLGIQHQTLINLDPDAIPESQCSLVSTNAEQDSYISHLLEKLSEDLRDGSPAGNLYGESLCTALALYGLRAHGRYPVRRCEFKGGLPAATLTRIVDYIFANLTRDLTIVELATVAGHTPNSFRKLFEKSVRRPVHQFVLDARIETARALLRRDDADLTSVAAAVGFCHQSHFSEAFRRRAGLSPGRFRAEATAAHNDGSKSLSSDCLPSRPVFDIRCAGE
jgi:AraC family transcriptional regulator